MITQIIYVIEFLYSKVVLKYVKVVFEIAWDGRGSRRRWFQGLKHAKDKFNDRGLKLLSKNVAKYVLNNYIKLNLHCNVINCSHFI